MHFILFFIYSYLILLIFPFIHLFLCLTFLSFINSFSSFLYAFCLAVLSLICLFTYSFSRILNSRFSILADEWDVSLLMDVTAGGDGGGDKGRAVDSGGEARKGYTEREAVEKVRLAGYQCPFTLCMGDGRRGKERVRGKGGRKVRLACCYLCVLRQLSSP